MDPATFLKITNEAIDAKLKDCKPFTTACISHAVIAESIRENLKSMSRDDAIKERIRHREVRAVVEDRFAADDMYGDDNGMQVPYITTQITVWPETNKPVNVRLFHPDDPTFDPQSFQATHLNLQKTIDEVIAQIGTAGADVTTKVVRPISMDTDGDDDLADTSMPSIKITATGHPVTAHCEIQKCQDTLNIPRVLVKSAGWVAGDEITVRAVGSTIYVRKVDKDGDQKIDAEGRIRVHGENARILRQTNTLCTALVAEPKNGDEKYIQIQ